MLISGIFDIGLDEFLLKDTNCSIRASLYDKGFSLSLRVGSSWHILDDDVKRV